MKVIALAVAAIVVSSPAFAQSFTGNPFYPGQTASVSVQISGAPTSAIPTFIIGNAVSGTIDVYQAGSSGLPAGTQADINNFQTGAAGTQQTIAAGNPSPGTGLPAGFTVGFATGALPLVK